MKVRIRLYVRAMTVAISAAVTVVAMVMTVSAGAAEVADVTDVSRRYMACDTALTDTRLAVTVDTLARATAFEARVAFKGRSNDGRWGIRWTDREGGRYELSVSRADDDTEMAATPSLTLKMTHNGTETARRKLTKGVATAAGFNTLTVENNAEQTLVFIGSEIVQPIEMDAPGGVMAAGYEFFAEGSVETEYMVVEESLPTWRRVVTGWDDESIDTYLASCRQPEGVWSYLDRETDPVMTRPGGKYRLMLVKGSDGLLELIYLDGAEVGSRQWRRGMLKGVLTPTSFAGQYDLTWYDAQFVKRADEAYATFDEMGRVLTLTFPLLKATMRFSREM